MKKYLLLQAIVVFLLTGCAMTNLKDSNFVGKVYKGSIQLQSLDIPLPEGEWLVIGSGNKETTVTGGRSNDATDDQFQVVLLKKSDLGQVIGLLFISTDMMGNKLIGYSPGIVFNRTDVHHVVVNNNDNLGAHDCWLINHSIVPKISKNTVAKKEAFKYFESNKIVIPKIMIESYHHFTGKYNKNKLLDYSYLINPEIDGFDSPKDTDWSTCEWNLLQINKDHKKVEYIEKLKVEGAAMHEKLHKAFGE